jgi:O-antigen/teichoic acid export membrane protein
LGLDIGTWLRARIAGGAWLGAFTRVYAGRLLSAALAFGSAVWVARALGPDAYGRFAVLAAFIPALCGVPAAALDVSLVRFSGRFAADARDPTPYYATVLALKVVFVGGLLALALAAAPATARLLFPGEPWPGAVMATRLAFGGAAALVVLSYPLVVFQSRQQFTRFARLDVAHSAGRFACVAAILLLGFTAPAPVLVAYVAGPVVVGGLAFLAVPAGWRTLRGASWTVAGELLRFGKWVALAALCTSVAARADVLVMGALGVKEGVIGAYQAAVTVALAADMGVHALFSVLLPYASRLEAPADLRNLLARFGWLLLALMAVAAPALWLVGPAVRLAFGAAYGEATAFAPILLGGAVVSVAMASAGPILYRLGRSEVVGLMEAAKLAVIAVAGGLAAQAWGPLGMAWVVAVVKGGGALVTYGLAWRAVERAARARG